jgi:small redox-active disulfide protein 2
MIESIKVLGTGCAKCTKLQANVEEAIKEMGLDVKVEKVDDMEKIFAYGIMTTPGLVINEKLASYGSLLNVKQAKELLEKHLG